MNSRILTIWVAWVVWAITLNVASLLAYYYNAPATPVRPAVRFAQAEQAVSRTANDALVEVLLAPDQPLPYNIAIPYTAEARGATVKALPGGKAIIPAQQLKGELILTLPPDAVAEEVSQIILTLEATPEVAVVPPSVLRLTFSRTPTELPVVFLEGPASRPVSKKKGGALAVGVRLDRPAPKDVAVRYGLGGTADKGVSYKLLSPDGEIVIPKGEERAAIQFEILNQSAAAGDRSLIVSLQQSPELELGRQRMATIQIMDDDQPEIHLAVDKARVVEGTDSQCIVTAQLKEPTARPLTLRFQAKGTARAGTDYEALPGTLTIPAGQRSASFAITIKDNDILNPDDVQLVLEFEPPAHARLVPSNRLEITIVDDDSQGEALVLLLMTRQLQADWAATEKELKDLFTPSIRGKLFGGAVYLVAANGASRKWKPGQDPGFTDASLFFDENLHVNDVFTPGLQLIPKFTQQARNKRFATFLLWSSRTSPDDKAERHAAINPKLALPEQREVYAYWLGGYWLLNNKDRATWFAAFKDSGGQLADGTKIRGDRLMAREQSFADDLIRIIKNRKKNSSDGGSR